MQFGARPNSLSQQGTLRACSCYLLKHVCVPKQSPVRACLDCEVRRAIRVPHLITRQSSIKKPLQECLDSSGSTPKGAGSGQDSTYKCGSTRKNAPDFEPQEAASSDQQLTEGAGGKHNNIGVQAALGLLWLYKNGISPLLPKSCRFIPTCSTYSVESYQEFGFWKGSALTTWRVLRCNPLSKGGFDPPRWPPLGLEWAFGHDLIRDK